MDFIESKDNPRYKSALNIRKGKDSGLIFVEGARLCEEALKSGLKIELALFSKEFLGSAGTLARQIESAARDAAVLKTRLFDSISDTKNPQGAALVCERPVSTLETIRTRLQDPSTAVPIAVMLLEINNPGNLGAVLRTVEAAGAAGVVTSKGSVDAFSPAVLRGSMGASFRLPLAEKVSESEAFEWARQAGLRVIVTDSNAPTLYTDADLTSPALLVFGSEAHGLSKAALESADLGLRIPLDDRVESLNLAVSAGVLLFEAKRQARH
ncbi:MAG: RNA methyltransferase [Acidobacteriota bacterium]|nr:MAG: RNA methyltransferase [Acidobacteriota bacterium]